MAHRCVGREKTGTRQELAMAEEALIVAVICVGKPVFLPRLVPPPK
jgi:hypothetical protein